MLVMTTVSTLLFLLVMVTLVMVEKSQVCLL